MLNAGERLFIAGRKAVTLMAERRAAAGHLLHFFLDPAVELGRPTETHLLP
jgi:hypothetical protein